MMRFLAAVLLLGGLFHHPTCARAEDRFFRPPAAGPTGDYRDNPVYAVGDRIELQWETSLQSADLVLWQEQQPDGDDDARPAYARLAVNMQTKSLTWTVGYAGFPAYHDPDLSPVYYLELCEAGETAGARSHYFNITGTKPASAGARATTKASRMSRTRLAGATVSMTTTMGNTTTTTTTTMTSTTATSLAPDPEDDVPTASPSLSPSPTATAASSVEDGGGGGNTQQQKQQPAGMPAGTVAGIAVGAAVVGLALLGAAVWAVRRRAAWLRRRWGGGCGGGSGGCGMSGCGMSGVAHTQGDIVLYAERQLRETGAVGWVSPPSPLGRKVRLPVESREALAFELEAGDGGDWARCGEAAAVDRAVLAGEWGWVGPRAAGWGSRSTRSGSSGLRSMGSRSMGSRSFA